MKTPIFGPFYVGRSTNLADNRLINLFPSIVETKQGKEVGALYLCPGLDFLAFVGSGPCRGMHTMGDSLFIVSGNQLYRVSTGFDVFALGDVPPGVVSMIDNGTQVAVFAGVNGFVWSQAAGFAPIVLPFSPTGAPITASYQDGFGVINQPLTSLWFQSDLLDLATWNALNFGDASGDPDNVVVVKQIKREVWLIKENETEMWYNALTPNFTFARIDGAYIEAGTVAIGSVVRVGESLIWLTKNQSGQGWVGITRGHGLVRISTHAIEVAIAAYPTITDAVGFSYQQEGHEFYVLNFPSGDATWVYDVTESALVGVPMWHERLSIANGVFHRHRAEFHANFANRVVVGDYQNGNLYAFNLDTLTDNGAQRKWLRSWRALAQPSEQPVRFNSLRIDMQTGIGLAPATADPVCVLRYSDDGGHQWSSEKFAEVGETGETARRVMFRRLGATRRNSGLDRIFELSGTDPFPVAIIGAELEAA